MLRAKLIQDGDHQTIVLPASIRLAGDEVLVDNTDANGDLTISQIAPKKKIDWQAVFRAFDEAEIPDDFLQDRYMSPPQERPDW